MTEENKNKLRGKKSWNKGQITPEETRKKMSDSRILYYKKKRESL